MPIRPGAPLSEELRAFTVEHSIKNADLAAEIDPQSRTVSWIDPVMSGARPFPASRWPKFDRWVSQQSARWQHRLRSSDNAMRARVGKRPREIPRYSGPTVDIVGLGALNYDLILPASAYGASPRLQMHDSDHEVKIAGRTDLQDLINELASHHGTDARTLFAPVLGGSTFNVIRALCEADPLQTLAMVGVGGSIIDGFTAKQSHYQYLSDSGIDCNFVREDADQLGGHCVSVVVPDPDGEASRRMATFPGNNMSFGQHLTRNFWQICDLICSARAVHVASLFDNESPSIVADLLRYCVMMNPDLEVFFDPGYAWASGHLLPTEIFRDLLSVTSTLFVTNVEFNAIVENHALRHSGLPDQSQKLFPRLRRTRSVIVVVKQSGTTAIYRPGLAPATVALPDRIDKVEDDTGAGDVFAAGYMSQTLRGRSPHEAAFAGMSLAREKLRQVGLPTPNTLRRIIDSSRQM